MSAMIWKEVKLIPIFKPTLCPKASPKDREEDKCICFGEASEKIEQYKKDKYPIQTVNSTGFLVTEERNCILVATLGNTKVKDQYDECLEALKGKQKTSQND